MMQKYSPILNWKEGEQKTLAVIEEDVKNNIKPILILPLPNRERKKGGKTIIKSKDEILNEGEEKIKKALDSSCWNERDYYFCLNENWYDFFDGSMFNADLFIRYLNCARSESNGKVTPIITLSNFVNNYTLLCQYKDDICIRIHDDDYFQLQSDLSQLLDDKKLNSSNVDLLLDLGYVYSPDLYSKILTLQTAIKNIGRPDEYRSIIVASCSMLQSFSKFNRFSLIPIDRNENKIHKEAKLLSSNFFKYIYADYGPSLIETVEYIPGMKTNFKLKYTTENSYVCLYGNSMKKGGFSIQQASDCCKKLVTTSDFLGKSYSFGDKVIDDVATKTAPTGGSPTTWITNHFTHHITLISKII